MVFKIYLYSTYHRFRELYNSWKNYNCAVNQWDKIILHFKKDNAHYTISLSRAEILSIYTYIYVIAS